MAERFLVARADASDWSGGAGGPAPTALRDAIAESAATFATAY
jgi:hypothetical protein